MPSGTTFGPQSLPHLETILPHSKVSSLSKSPHDSDLSSETSRVNKDTPIASPEIVKPPFLMNSSSPFGTKSFLCNSFIRRPRGEKRPIPEAQKDEKYFERRKRNNEAAKKSRDARKLREDRVIKIEP